MHCFRVELKIALNKSCHCSSRYLRYSGWIRDLGIGARSYVYAELVKECLKMEGCSYWSCPDVSSAYDNTSVKAISEIFSAIFIAGIIAMKI